MPSPARIDQFLPSYVPFDAIGIHTKHIQERLRERGFVSDIFCEHWHQVTENQSQQYKYHRRLSSPNNMIIYHHSIGSFIPNYLAGVPDYCVQSYHNITPPEYFAAANDRVAYDSCAEGIRQLSLLQAVAHDNWTVSEYNARELIRNGFSHVDVFPILRDYTALKRRSESTPKSILDDGKTNLLFVGRVCPHKAQHDLIMTLKAYKAHLGKDIRLILVGGHAPQYVRKLYHLVDELGIRMAASLKERDAASADVLLLGNVSDDVLSQAYRAAHVFVCLSEHEGFCVPLVEAMTFGIPLVVHDATAIPETCGDAAIVVNKHQHPEQIVREIHRLATSSDYFAKRQADSLSRSRDFAWDRLIGVFDSCLDQAIETFVAQKKH